MLLNKDRQQIKLLNDKKIHNCFICKKPITIKDIREYNFEVIDKKYVHSNCIDNHIPRLD